MDAPEVKAELLRLLADDADVRAALLALVDDPPPGGSTLTIKAASWPAPAPTMTDAVSRVEIPPRPGWLRKGNYLAR